MTNQTLGGKIIILPNRKVYKLVKTGKRYILLFIRRNKKNKANECSNTNN